MAIDMFLKIGNVAGESVDDKHPGEIEVLAYSIGFSNSGSVRVGGGAGAGKVSPQDLSFTTYVSKASPVLFTAVCTGRIFDTAVLTVRKAGDHPLDYVQLKLQQVMVTSQSMGGSGGEDRLTENYSLNYAKLTFIYTGQNNVGQPLDPVRAGFDFVSNTKL